MKGLRVTNIASLAMGLALTAICLLFPHHILSLFMDSAYADAHEAIMQGISLLTRAAAANIFVFANYCYAAVLRGAGDVVFTSIGMVTLVAFRIALAYLLVFFGVGYVSISISLFAMHFIAAILMFSRLKGGKWKEKAFAGQSGVRIH
jgi:Na+-driven multidrug efflux pump